MRTFKEDSDWNWTVDLLDSTYAGVSLVRNSAAYIFIPKVVCDVTYVMGFKNQMTILS